MGACDPVVGMNLHYDTMEEMVFEDENALRRFFVALEVERQGSDRIFTNELYFTDPSRTVTIWVYDRRITQRGQTY